MQEKVLGAFLFTAVLCPHKMKEVGVRFLFTCQILNKGGEEIQEDFGCDCRGKMGGNHSREAGKYTRFLGIKTIMECYLQPRKSLH